MSFKKYLILLFLLFIASLDAQAKNIELTSSQKKQLQALDYQIVLPAYIPEDTQSVKLTIESNKYSQGETETIYKIEFQLQDGSQFYVQTGILGLGDCTRGDGFSKVVSEIQHPKFGKLFLYKEEPQLEDISGISQYSVCWFDIDKQRGINLSIFGDGRINQEEIVKVIKSLNYWRAQ